MDNYTLYRGYEIIIKKHTFFVGNHKFWSMTEAQQFIDDTIELKRDMVYQREIEEWYQGGDYMASISNNYEINVAKKNNPADEYGKHFCKIQLSETFEDKAEEKLAFFRDLFGEEYHVSMTYWVCHGEVKDEWK